MAIAHAFTTDYFAAWYYLDGASVKNGWVPICSQNGHKKRLNELLDVTVGGVAAAKTSTRPIRDSVCGRADAAARPAAFIQN